VSYEPKPIDTSKIVLAEEIRALTELLARNAHELWAKRRLVEGWRRGPRRDDIHKEHPDLVPYDELSEAEKEYDRQAAMESIKTIIALGYRIEKRS